MNVIVLTHAPRCSQVEGYAEEWCKQLDFYTVIGFTAAFALYNLWHAAYVRTQLFFNNIMTDQEEIGHHGFAPAQMGQVNSSGEYEKVDVHVNSVFGQYSDRPAHVQANEVLPTMWLLLTSIWEGHASHTETRNEYRRRSLAGEGGFIKLEEGGDAEKAAEASAEGTGKPLWPLNA